MQETDRPEKKQPRKSGNGKRNAVRYSFECKLRAVKLHLEEGFSRELVCEEMGMSVSCFALWLRAYRERGEEGLRSVRRTPGGGGRRTERARLGGGGDRAHCGTQAAEPVVGHQAHSAGSEADVFAACQPGDGAPAAAHCWINERLPHANQAKCDASPILRTRDPQSDVAERHLHLPAGRAVCLSHRVPGRLLTLRGGCRLVPQPHGAGGDRGVP